MKTWKSKVFGNAVGLKANQLYVARLVDDEDASDDKVKFSYEIKRSDGSHAVINRSIKMNKYSLKNWLKDNTGFDDSDSDMTELKAAEHLVLIGQYEGFSFVQKVYPMGEELLIDE